MRKFCFEKKWLWLLCLVMLAMPAAVYGQDAEPTVNTGAEEPVIHTVESGESLTYIANLYETSIDKILFLNNLNPDNVLFIGQNLIVSGYVPNLPAGAALIVNDALLNAPDLPPVPKMHTVQSGESLTSIAGGYGLSLEALLIANSLGADHVLQIGDLLQIPNVAGELVAFEYAVQVGDTLETISAEFNTHPTLLFQNKTLLNKRRLIAGQRLSIISRTGSANPIPQTGVAHVVQAGESLLSVANQYKLSPIALANENKLTYPSPLYAGQRLRVPNDQRYSILPGDWATIQVSESALTQGETFSVFVENRSGNDVWGRIRQLSGALTSSGGASGSAEITQPLYEQQFPFAPHNDRLVAIVGLDAFTPSGLYMLELFDGGETPSFSQAMQVLGGGYGTQQITISDSLATLLAPEIRAADDAVLTPIYSTFTPEMRWDSSQPLRSPLDISYTTAQYGAARSYNGGPYSIFHTGVDYAAPVGTPIVSVANGTVVFSASTNLRGNMVVIDHGMGVMSGYFHMTTLLVQAGDIVERGQALGGLGSTGLVSGAHLHWDLRIRDMAVNGAQWLEKAFP